MLTATESIAYAVGGGRQREAIYVILTAYLDKSGTHAGTTVMTVGGFVSPVRNWRDFDRRWAKMLSKRGLSYFHSKEHLRPAKTEAHHARNGELIDRIDSLTRRHLFAGFSVSLPRADYREHYCAKSERIKGVRFDSEYGLCVRSLVYEIARICRAVLPW